MARRSVLIASVLGFSNENVREKTRTLLKMEGLREGSPGGCGDRRPKPRLC
jgi:hypothetical protein